MWLRIFSLLVLGGLGGCAASFTTDGSSEKPVRMSMLSERDSEQVLLVRPLQVVTNGTEAAALIPLPILWEVIYD